MHVRPIRPEDSARLLAFHDGLSTESIRFRFFSGAYRPSPKDLERFTDVDGRDRVALVVELGDDVIAVGRYDRLPGADEAEVAFVVDDAHQDRGIGTILLEQLAVVARDNGVSRFVADVLSHNRRMQGVFQAAGFVLERELEHGVVHFEFAIEPTAESEAAVVDREHTSEASSIRRLLCPESIAVVGASPRSGTIGHEIFQNLLDCGFDGPVFPVHPKAPHVGGVRAYARVTDIPDDVDLAVVVVPAPAVPGVLEDCAAKGTEGLIVISAGFAETGAEGAAAERRIVEFARRHGMRMIGPNCMGVVNTAPGVSMNATFAPAPPERGSVGFLSQSGALGIAILERAGSLNLGISSFASVGNKADVSGNDLLQYWEDDPETDVVLLYLESFGNPRKFSRIARRVSRKKPIVVVKSGRSGAGTRAASSHTAAAASPDVAVDALFHQTGVLRVDTLEQLFDVARVLANQPIPRGRRVCILGNSGGPGILAADACEGAGLEVPELSEATQKALVDLLPSAAAVRNPVDMVASATPAEYGEALRFVLADESIDAVIVIFTPPLVTRADDVAVAIASASAEAGPKAIVANFLAMEGTPEPMRTAARRIPSFAFPESAALALARAARYGEWLRRPEGTVRTPQGVAPELARAVVDSVTAHAPDGRWLDADEAAVLTSAYGIPTALTLRAGSSEDAADAADALGYPVALKAGAGDIVHKTDMGAVRLDLASASEVMDAFDEMAAALGDSMGDAVVQRMADAGVETIVGVVQDPSFGPLIMFGMGGIATEILGDRAFRVLPLTDLDAAELVGSVRGSRLLSGYRGRPPMDVGALTDLLIRVSCLVEDLPEVVEMDLNPVIVSTEGAVAVDAKVRLVPYRPRPELALRRL